MTGTEAELNPLVAAGTEDANAPVSSLLLLCNKGKINAPPKNLENITRLLG